MRLKTCGTILNDTQLENKSTLRLICDPTRVAVQPLSYRLSDNPPANHVNPKCYELLEI